jgi:hypothetical protein
MEFPARHAAERHPPTAATARCPQCRADAMVLDHRHVSPARLGAALVTEYWICDCCDARYQFSPADGRWRPIYH